MEGEELSFECQELPITTQHTFDEGWFETQLYFFYSIIQKLEVLKNASEFVIFLEYETPCGTNAVSFSFCAII